MKIVFFGSDDFAVINLERLIGSKHEVAAVVTQPDRAQGRGMKIGISPVKECAGSNDISVLQPEDLSDPSFIEQVNKYKSDLFVVIAYGKFLPSELLEVPAICSVNVHGSLLPKYRGAAPINWAIINGDQKTGVSIIKMNSSMDAGDVIASKEIIIDKLDTSVTLRAKMAVMGADLLVETIDDIGRGDYSLTSQDEGEVTKASKLKRELGLISWGKSAEDINNLIRGLLPWPSAYTRFENKILKILDAEIIDVTVKHEVCGEVLDIINEGFCISAGVGTLLVKRVHLESSKQMDAKSFAAGHKLTAGHRFS